MNDYYLEKSNRKDKKYMVHFINPETKRINTIHFGSKNYSDMTQHKDEKRKERYIKRHQKNEDFGNLKKAAAWARYILWGEKTIKKSIKEMEKKFNIKIHLVE
jgi:hypothetical protein